MSGAAGRMFDAPPPTAISAMLVHCHTTENCSWSEPDVLERISIISYRYCYPTISGAGIVGSLLLLLTLCDARFRAAGVYTYLRCLMVADCAALAMGGPTFFVETWQLPVVCDGHHLQPRPLAEAVWRVIFVPLANAMVGFSMGITLWMTYDRYMAVRVPRELWRHRRPARRCGGRPLRIAATLLVSLMLHVPQTLGYQVVEHCPAGGGSFYEVSLRGSAVGWVWSCYQWTLQVLVRWLPAGVVLYCNGYIILAIKRRERHVQTISRSIDQHGTESISQRVGSQHWQEGTASQCGDVGPPSVSELPLPPPPTPSRAPSASIDSTQRHRQRRQEAERRMEFLLAATAASYMVSNCLQSALFIMELVYEQEDSKFQVNTCLISSLSTWGWVANVTFKLDIRHFFVVGVVPKLHVIRVPFMCGLSFCTLSNLCTSMDHTTRTLMDWDQ